MISNIIKSEKVHGVLFQKQTKLSKTVLDTFKSHKILKKSTAMMITKVKIVVTCSGQIGARHREGI